MTESKDALVAEFKDDGFFTHIRNMDFRKIEATRMLEKIRRLSSEDMTIENRLEVIGLLWSVPYYALRYRKACVEMGADAKEYDQTVHELHNAIRDAIKAILAEVRAARS
jgi:intein/homing endonuclease